MLYEVERAELAYVLVKNLDKEILRCFAEINAGVAKLIDREEFWRLI